MTDSIEIRGLRVMTVVGVLDHERQSPQPLEVDVTITADLTAASNDDVLALTVDYGDVCTRIADLVTRHADLLLERVAGRIADMILTIARVEAVSVTVRKLRPPIPAAVDTTGVRIERRVALTSPPVGQHRGIIALGSNLGDRAGFLRFAVAELATVTEMSNVYETEPVGGPAGQDAFLNMVVVVGTDLDPYALLRRCHAIEAQAQRQRLIHWGPRTLDLDLLYYDDVTISDPDLTIPHPRIADRPFVLVPLAEVAPHLVPSDNACHGVGVRVVGTLRDL